MSRPLFRFARYRTNTRRLSAGLRFGRNYFPTIWSAVEMNQIFLRSDAPTLADVLELRRQWPTVWLRFAGKVRICALERHAAFVVADLENRSVLFRRERHTR